MDAPDPPFDALIRSAARRLKGHQRRLFLAEVANQLCEGSARQRGCSGCKRSRRRDKHVGE